MLHWRNGSLVVEGAGRAQYRPGDGALVPFSPYPVRALATANQLPSPVSSKNPSKPPPPTNHRPFVIVLTSKVGQGVQVAMRGVDAFLFVRFALCWPRTPTPRIASTPRMATCTPWPTLDVKTITKGRW